MVQTTTASPALWTLVLALASLSAAAETKLRDISQLQWQNRVILINGGESSQAKIAKLDKWQAAIAERDIAWFVLNGEQVDTNYTKPLHQDLARHIRSRYLRQSHPVVLVGKDGGIKVRDNRLNLLDLFETIDAMPMRQQEMLQRGL